MWWSPPQVIVSLDPASQAALDRLAQTTALLTETLAKIGKTMSALTDAANTLVSEVAEGIQYLHSDQAKIADQAAQIVALLASQNTEEATTVAAQLVQSAADLKTTLDALHPPVDATPAPAPAPSA